MVLGFSLLSLACILVICQREGLLRDWAMGRHRWTLPPLILVAVAVVTRYGIDLSQELQKAALYLLAGN